MSKFLLNRVRLGIEILHEIEEYLLGMDDLEGEKKGAKNASPFSSFKIDKKSIKNTTLVKNHDYKNDPKDNCPICPDNMDPDEFLKIIEGQTQRETAIVTSEVKPLKEIPEMPSLKEGNIIKRKDGRWMGRYRINGETKSVYAHTKPAIIEKINALVHERNNDEKNSGISKKMTLLYWVNTWFEEYKIAKSRSRPLKPSTIENVKYTLIQSTKHSKIGKKLSQTCLQKTLTIFWMKFQLNQCKQGYIVYFTWSWIN